MAVARMGAVWLESGDVVNLMELIIPKIASKYSALLPALVKVPCRADDEPPHSQLH